MGLNFPDLIGSCILFSLAFSITLPGMSKYIIFWGVTRILDPDTSKSFCEEKCSKELKKLIYGSHSEQQKCQEMCSTLALIFCSCLHSELELPGKKTLPLCRALLQGYIL